MGFIVTNYRTTTTTINQYQWHITMQCGKSLSLFLLLILSCYHILLMYCNHTYIPYNAKKIKAYHTFSATYEIFPLPPYQHDFFTLPANDYM